MSTTFVFETYDQRNRRLLALLVLGVIVLSGIAFSVQHIAQGGALPNFQAWKITPVSLFFMAAIGGLFFFPVPIEAIFFAGLRAGNDATFSLTAVLTGFILGNIVSYLIGWKLSRTFMSVMPAKKLHAVRKYVMKWGAPAVFILNALPMPSPLLTFGLGIARYNVARLFTLLLAGNLVKFTFIIWFNGFI